MRFVFHFLTLCFYLLITSVYSVHAVERYAEVIYPKLGSIKNLVLEDISADGMYTVFSTNQNNVDGDLSGLDTSFYDIYLRNHSDGTITKISKGYDGTIASRDSYQAIFVGSDDIIFSSYANNIVKNGDYSYQYYRYTISTKQIIQLDMPISGYSNSSSIVSSGSGKYVFVAMYKNLYKLNDEKTKFELTNISFDKQIKVHGVGENGRLIISDQSYQTSKLFIVEPDLTYKEIFTGTDTNLSYQYLDGAISNNGHYAAFVNSTAQEINIVDLNSTSLTLQTISNTLFTEKEILYDEIDISDDGVYVSVKTKPVFSMQQTSNINNQTSSIFVVDVNSGKAINASAINAEFRKETNGQARFTGIDNSLYFVGNVYSPSVYSRVYQQVITADMFEFKGDLSNFKVISESPLSANLSITSTNNNFRIKRTNTSTQKSVFLTSSKLQSVDFKFGLEPGEYNYSVVPCSFNFVCDLEAEKNAKISIKSFSKPPELDVVKTIPNSINEQSFITISSALTENASVTQIQQVGGSSNYIENEQYKITINQSKDIGLFSRFCVQNFDSSYSCDNYSSPLIVKTPFFLRQAQISASPLPDFSAIKVKWQTTTGYSYQLYRTVSQTSYSTSDYELIYSGAESEFTDTQTNFGMYVTYRVVQCLDGLCTSRAITEKVGRSRSPISINASMGRGLADIRINAEYSFEQIKLYRREVNGGKPEEYLGDIDLNTLEYIDQAVLPGTSYIYRVEGCNQGQCNHEDSEQNSTNTLNVDLIPASPKNLKVQLTHFMGATLSWDKVEGADGYLVKVLNSESSSNSTLTTVGNDSTSLIHRFENLLGLNFSYSVTSFKYDNRDGNSVAAQSLPSKSVTLSSIESITQQKLLPVVFLLLDYQSQWPKIAIRINESPAYDSFQLFKRVKGQNEIVLDTVLTPPSYDYSIYVTEQVDIDTTYEYFVIGCSTILNSCSEKVNPVEITFYPENEVPIVDTSPTLSWDVEGFLRIKPNIPQSGPITSVTAKVYNPASTSHFQSLSIKDQNGELQSSHSNLQANGIVFVTTTYCFKTPNGSNKCAEESQKASITLPANAKIKPSVSSIRNFKTEVFVGRANVNFDLNFETTSIRSAEEIRVFKAINNQPLELIKVETNIQSRFANGNYKYTEQNITLGQSIRYQVQLCNTVGCSLLSNVQGKTLVNTGLAVPAVPRIKNVTDYNQLVSVKVDIEPISLATSYRLYVAKKTNNMDSYETITTFSSIKNNLSADTLYYFSLAACNAVGCSEKSQPISHQTLGRVSANTEISGLKLWDAAKNYNYRSIWEVRNVSASNGRLDTVQGTAKYNQWIDFNKGINSRTQTFLSIKDLNSCKSLMSFGLKVPSSSNQNNEYVRTLFEFIYTGAGCDSNTDLELYSLYLDSDYLAAPLLIENKEEWLEQWLTLDLHTDENGQVTLIKNNVEIFSTDNKLELNIYAYSQLLWTASPNSWISHMSIKSLSEQEVRLDFELVRPSSSLLDAVHPKVVQVQYPPSVSVELVPIVDGQYSEIITFNADPSSDNNRHYSYLTELKPKQKYEWLVRHCDGDVCGPYYYDQETMPVYNTLNSISAPYQSSSLVEGELMLYHSFSSYVDDYTLYGRKSDETEATAIASLSYLDIVNNFQGEAIGRVYWKVANYKPNDKVYFSLKVCNPIACNTSAETNMMTVPIDTDQDGVIDERDAFPEDPSETYDTDGDGIGNNADQDDDNDGIPDEFEVQIGLNPLNQYDGQLDLDHDGYSNAIEYQIGSELNDETSTPKTEGIFVSFEKNEAIPVTITSPFELSSYNGAVHGLYSLEKRFSSVYQEKLIISVKGKMKAGRLGWAYRIYNSFSQGVYINGRHASYDDDELSSIGNKWYWRSIAVPDGYAEIEIRFSGGSDDYVSGLNLDALFIPMLKPDGDFDGDLKADILWRNQTDGRNVFWKMAGYVGVSQSLDINPVRDTNWQIVGRGDFSGDGKSDILWRNKVSGANTIFTMNSATIVSSESINPVRDMNWQVKGVQDFDGDGKADIFWHHATRGDTVIFLMNGHAIKLSQGVKTVTDLNWEVAAVGDMNGDNKGDILWRHKLNGKTIVWQMDGAKLAKSYSTKTVDTSWTLVGLGDLDGNGSDDIIWRNKLDGRNWAHLMHQSQLLRSQQINTVADSNWYIADILDLNGDGKDDLFWRNKANDNTYVYWMSGVKIEQRGYLKNVNQVWQNIH